MHGISEWQHVEHIKYYKGHTHGIHIYVLNGNKLMCKHGHNMATILIVKQCAETEHLNCASPFHNHTTCLDVNLVELET